MTEAYRTEHDAAAPLAPLLAELFLGRSSRRGQLVTRPDGGRVITASDSLTPQRIADHVAGGVRRGAFPFTDDERVGWACIDLDVVKWLPPHGPLKPDDPETFAIINRIVEALAVLGIRAVVERSREKGWHVWVFFSEPAQALDVRALLLPIATEAGARKEADLVCPRQDVRGPTGNGTWLPLYGGFQPPATRFYEADPDSGDWLPAEDQGAVLRELIANPTPASCVPRTKGPSVGARPRDAHSPGGKAGDLPPRVEALLANDPDVCARFERHPGEHDDHSNSGIDASLAALTVKRLTDAEPWEVEAALRASHEKAGIRDPKYNDRYFARCVELAFKLPEWLVKMNDEYGCAWWGSNYVIFHEPKDATKPIEFISSESFARAMQNKPKIGRGKNKMRRDTAWLTHPSRREYREIVFYPGPVEAGVYNLWRGFSVAPREGSCERYLEHVRTNVCRDNARLFQWVEAWMADAVQHPAERPGTAVALRGGEGVGKGAAARGFGSLFGRAFVHVTHARHFTGNFNKHLLGRLIVYPDEAFWAGDKQGESVLKGIITEPTFMFEQKGKDAVEMPNFMRIILSSNHDWVVPAGLDARRFAVLDVGDAHAGDANYFAAIQKELDAGGREALLHHLLRVDTSRVDLRKVPQTEALREQKVYSMNPVTKWWLHRLRQGTLPPGGDETTEERWRVWRSRVFCSALHDDFVRHSGKAGQGRRASETELGIGLRKLVPGLKRKQMTLEVSRWNREGEVFEPVQETGWAYLMPARDTCREHFDRITHTKNTWGDDE